MTKDDDEAATPRASGTVDEIEAWLRQQIADDREPHTVPQWHEVWCLSAEVDDGRCFYCGQREDTADVELVPKAPEVLAGCDSRERLLEFLLGMSDEAEQVSTIVPFLGQKYRERFEHGLKLLALAYQHRDGYQEAWRL